VGGCDTSLHPTAPQMSPRCTLFSTTSPEATRKSLRALVDAALVTKVASGLVFVLYSAAYRSTRSAVNSASGSITSPPARNRISAAKSVSKLAETQAEGQDLVNLTLAGYHGDVSRHWFRRFS
jgi:hypothetical protein